MIIGVLLSGVLTGVAAALWALASGKSLLVVLALYPLAGVLGVSLFLALAVLRQVAFGQVEEPLVLVDAQ
jgi:hypothetical protein